MSPSRGSIGVRWNVADANKDTLWATVEIRGESESTWIRVGLVRPLFRHFTGLQAKVSEFFTLFLDAKSH